MRKVLVLMTLAALALVGVAPAASAGGTTAEVYYEFVAPEDVTFIPACTPGPDNPTCDPRGPGSVLISVGTLSETQGGAPVGSIKTECVTTKVVDGDYYGYCFDTLNVGNEKIVAHGEINQSAVERFEPATLDVMGGGTLEVAQIVFPNEFRLTLTR